MAPPPVILKDVEVKETAFTDIKVPADLKQYMVNSVEKGSNAVLYADPAITASFYGKGTDAGDDIQTAIDAEKLNASDDNKLAVSNAMAAGVMWLKSYGAQVQIIANLSVNRITREQAAENILRSYLSYKKLKSDKKGDPAALVFTVEVIGSGKIRVTIVNGTSNFPTRTNLIAIQLPSATMPLTANPVVTLADGQISVQLSGAAEVVSKSLSGKGTSTIIKVSNTGCSYIIYGFAQNGNKQVSELSAGLIVKL